MNDALLMGIGQPIGDLRYNRKALPCPQRTVARMNNLLDGAAADKFHDHAKLIILLRQRIERRDIRMIEAREALRLDEEPIDKTWIARKLGAEEFDRYLAAELGIDSCIDFASASRCEPLDDLILADHPQVFHNNPSGTLMMRVVTASGVSSAAKAAILMGRVAPC